MVFWTIILNRFLDFFFIIATCGVWAWSGLASEHWDDASAYLANGDAAKPGA